MNIRNPDWYYGYTHGAEKEDAWYNAEFIKQNRGPGFETKEPVIANGWMPIKKKAIYSQLLTELLA